MLIFKCEINFFNIIKNIKVIIMFFARFFNVMLIVKKKEIIRALNIRVLSLEVKFTILNKFAIVSRLN